MTSRALVYERSKLRGSELDQGSVGGAATVEVVGFPQMLFTRSGDLESFFIPLLDTARRSYAMLERVVANGESKANAASLAAMDLASSLLRNPGFSMMARGHGSEHTYSVDLAEDRIEVTTRLYAAVSRRASMFKVNMTGKVSGGPFTIRQEGQTSSVVLADEQHLRTPEFLSRTLPEQCLRAQIENQRHSQVEESLGLKDGAEVRFMLASDGQTIPAIVRQAVGGSWLVLDGRTQDFVTGLPAEAENHLKRLMICLEELFAKR
jgi:hypothetical protein